MPDFGKYFHFFGGGEAVTKSATHADNFNLGSVASGFSFNSITIFAILIVVCMLLFVLSIGRTRALVSLLSIYIAFTIQTIFPFFGWLGEVVNKDLAILRVGVLLLGYIASFVLLNRSVLRGRLGLGDAAFFSVIIMGLLQLGLFASMVLNLAPSFESYIPDFARLYLTTQKALFVWFLAPLVLIAFQKSRD